MIDVRIVPRLVEDEALANEMEKLVKFKFDKLLEAEHEVERLKAELDKYQDIKLSVQYLVGIHRIMPRLFEDKGIRDSLIGNLAAALESVEK